MVDPDNEERLLKIPYRVRQEIKAEALREAVQRVEEMPIHLVDVRFDMDDEPDYRQTVELAAVIAAIKGVSE